MARASLVLMEVVLDPSVEMHSWEVLKIMRSHTLLVWRLSFMMRRRPSSPENSSFSKPGSSRFATWSSSSQHLACQ
jgi:hypothetical protein